jgi:hypothetical protein
VARNTCSQKLTALSLSLTGCRGTPGQCVCSTPPHPTCSYGPSPSAALGSSITRAPRSRGLSSSSGSSSPCTPRTAAPGARAGAPNPAAATSARALRSRGRGRGRGFCKAAQIHTVQRSRELNTSVATSGSPAARPGQAAWRPQGCTEGCSWRSRCSGLESGPWVAWPKLRRGGQDVKGGRASWGAHVEPRNTQG